MILQSVSGERITDKKKYGGSFMKKALALALALVMVAMFGVSALADLAVIDLSEEITSAAGTYVKISDADIWTAPTSTTDNTATYYTNGIGGVVYFAAIFDHGTYKNIKVDTTGIVSTEVLEYDPAVYSADDEVWKSISDDITFSINDTKSGTVVGYDRVTTVVNKGTYDEETDTFSVTEAGTPVVSYAKSGSTLADTKYNHDKTEQTVVTVETVEETTNYMEAKAAAKLFNSEGKTSKYVAACNQDVSIIKVRIANNFGVDYAIGTFQVKATGVADGKSYAGIKNNVVADVAIASKDTVEFYSEWYEKDAEGEIFPINEATSKNDFGYWGYYEDKVSTNKAFVISTTSFRAIAGEGITLANRADNPSVIVEIDKVATTQTGVNFLNESDMEYKTVDGKRVFDYYYLTFYGKQAIASDFTITWKPGCTYGELLTQFGLNLNESEQVKLHLSADGKDNIVTVDYSKVNLYDEVEIVIERTAGSTLGQYTLSSGKVDVKPNGNGGSGSGSGSEKNPNTGAPDMIGVIAAMTIVSVAAAAAISLKRK